MSDIVKECPGCGTTTTEDICPSCGTPLAEEELSLDDEFGIELEAELEQAEKDAELSSHTQEMAFGFPDWDLLPPNK